VDFANTFLIIHRVSFAQFFMEIVDKRASGVLIAKIGLHEMFSCHFQHHIEGVMATSFGKLKRYTLREYWREECGKFSLWLTQEDILEMIGESIDLKLVPAKQGNSVGLPKGGVLAVNSQNTEIVLLQGQLHDLTHEDFGQLISCAAELRASAIVWIASKIPIEYRNAVDWLNAMARHHISFYCAELELWRIDNSAPAANFHVVCQPRPVTGKAKDGQDSIEGRQEERQELPLTKNNASPQGKGVWTKDNRENLPTSPQSKPLATVKEEVAVRENFVYTKSF